MNERTNEQTNIRKTLWSVSHTQRRFTIYITVTSAVACMKCVCMMPFRGAKHCKIKSKDELPPRIPVRFVHNQMPP